MVNSLCRMYADDTKIYEGVGSVTECETLQKNLDNLVEWADKWQLRFNADIDKCQTLQLGNKNKKYEYILFYADLCMLQLQTSPSGYVIDCYTNECPCGTGVKDSEHIQQSCPTHTLERTCLWPSGADFWDKLCLRGSKEELQSSSHCQVHQERPPPNLT